MMLSNPLGATEHRNWNVGLETEFSSEVLAQRIEMCSQKYPQALVKHQDRVGY